MIAPLSALALVLAAAAALSGAAVADTPSPAPAVIAAESGRVLILLNSPPSHARPGGFSGGYGDEAGQAARRRQAARIAEDFGLELLDGWPMPLLGVDCFVLRVPGGKSPDDVAAQLAKAPGVVAAQVSNLYETQGSSPATASGDPLFRAQPAARAWRLDALHRIATGKGVRVAVIDSMVDRGHPDLAGQVKVSRNFVSGPAPSAEDHGTGVAGVIAARARNGVGIVGVAPESQIMALRACWETSTQTLGGPTLCDTYSLAQALHFAIDQGAEVINLSLAGPPDPILARLIDIAVSRGIRVVAAYDPALPKGGFPASHAGVIAVADDSRPPVKPVVFSAPGKGVPTTHPGGGWSIEDGSSFAAAHVSGLLALGRERQGAKDRPMSLIAANTSGEIDACATLRQVSRRESQACAP